MADSIPSQLSFSKLLSHTLPGIITAIGILLILSTSFNFCNKAITLSADSNNWISLIGAIGGLFLFGTILGIIIDTFHHLVIDPNLENIMERIKNLKDSKLKRIFGTLYLLEDKIKHETEIINNDFGEIPNYYYFLSFVPTDKFVFLDENFFCFVENAFNFSISFFCSSIIYSIYFFLLGSYIKGIIFLVVFLILSLFLFYGGLYYHLNLTLYVLYFKNGALEYYDSNLSENIRQ